MWAAVEQTLLQRQPKHCGNSWTVTDMCVSRYTQTGTDHFWHTRTQPWLAVAQGQLSTRQRARKLSVHFPFQEKLLDREQAS